MTDTTGAHDQLSLTKIVATLGPASSDRASLKRLVEAGVSVVRFNFSHGDLSQHAERLHVVRVIEKEIGRPIAVLGDLPGPKIRVTRVDGGGIELQAGQDIVFRREIDVAIPGAVPAFGCTYRPIVDEALPGHRVLINDGAIRALVVDAAPDEIRCRVTTGGLVTTGKGVNLPDSDISAPAITDRDFEIVEWAVENHLDFLAMSFVRRAQEVKVLKQRVLALCEGGAGGRDQCGVIGRIPIIAKIEKPQAVANIEEILDEADGIMVARGDLGVEMDLAQVPVTQKTLIVRAQAHGKPCIVATQMLESMIEHPSPTRAEVSDVANAIYDAADAVMLSGETAVGKYGSLAVDMMRRVANATESRLRELPQMQVKPMAERLAFPSHTAAIAHGAWKIASDLNAKVVACWSEKGETARRLSRLGFRIPVLAFSSDVSAVRRMALLYAVRPVHFPTPPAHRSDFTKMIDRFVQDHGMAERGDVVVTVSGKPMGKPGASDSVTVQIVGER